MPITFDDLYLADVAGGWGQITKQSTTQYLFSCKVIVGNGTDTYFSDIVKQITIATGVITGSGQTWFLLVNNSVVTFGTLINESLKSTKDGCSFLSLEATSIHTIINGGASTATYTLNLYSCSFWSSKEGGVDYADRVWNCKFSYRTYPCSRNTNFFNLILDGARYFYVTAPASGTSTIDRVSILSPSSNYIRCDSSALNTLYNVYGRGATTAIQVTNTGNTTLINPDFDVWTFTWTSSQTIFRKYEYDVTILNGEITDFVEDANVTLSKNGVQIGTWLTNSSGQIDTQILTYGFYNQTGGNTMYDGSYPFVLTVTHPDWADYTSRFYITEKTKMTISMQDTTTANNAAIIWSLLFGSVGFVLLFLWRRSHA